MHHFDPIAKRALSTLKGIEVDEGQIFDIENLRNYIEDMGLELADLRDELDDADNDNKVDEEAVKEINDKIHQMKGTIGAPFHHEERKEVAKLLQTFLLGCGVDAHEEVYDNGQILVQNP